MGAGGARRHHGVLYRDGRHWTTIERYEGGASGEPLRLRELGSHVPIPGEALAVASELNALLLGEKESWQERRLLSLLGQGQEGLGQGLAGGLAGGAGMILVHATAVHEVMSVRGAGGHLIYTHGDFVRVQRGT